MKPAEIAVINSHSPEEQNRQNPKPNKRMQNVKKVEIFMHNLDQQINHSYAKLKRNRSKITQGRKESNFLEQTTAFATSTVIQKTQQSYLSSTLHPSPRPQHTDVSIDQEQITLLDNKEVMHYIYLVYDLYNIKDPLQERQDNGAEKYQTKKKVGNYKDNFQRQIGSASTTKNSNMYKSIELNPFGDHKKSLASKQLSSATKMEVVSLKSKNQPKFNWLKKQEDTNEDQPITYRFKNKNVLAKKQKINISSTKMSQPQPNVGASSVPQLFRFCFMCQEPILQCNLLFHEQTCEPLKRALHYSIQQLIKILDGKIRYLKEQISLQLLEKSEQKIFEQFALIKATVRKWFIQLPSEEITRNIIANEQASPFASRTLNQKWRGEFKKVQESIKNTVYGSFQLLHKLQWFSKLRENISLNFFAIK